MMAKMIQKDATTLTFNAIIDMLSMEEMQENPTGHLLSNTSLFVNRAFIPTGSHGGQGYCDAPSTPSANQGKMKRKGTITMAVTSTRIHPDASPNRHGPGLSA